jgi:hypothetical protein
LVAVWLAVLRLRVAVLLVLAVRSFVEAIARVVVCVGASAVVAIKTGFVLANAVATENPRMNEQNTKVVRFVRVLLIINLPAVHDDSEQIAVTFPQPLVQDCGQSP